MCLKLSCKLPKVFLKQQATELEQKERDDFRADAYVLFGVCCNSRFRRTRRSVGSSRRRGDADYHHHDAGQIQRVARAAVPPTGAPGGTSKLADQRLTTNGE